MTARAARPVTIVLPSKRRARVVPRRGSPSASPDDPSMLGPTLAAIGRGALEVEVDGARLDREGALSLDVSDFHVLRDAAIRAGLAPCEPEETACDNCDATLRFDPASLELDDLSERYEEEAPLPRDRTFPLSAPIPIPRGGKATRVRMRSVSVREALPFFALLDGDVLALSPSVVRAMGVVALESDDGARRIETPVLLARALRRASDEVWADVEAAYLDHVYPRAAVAPLLCPSCGTLREMEVPWPRELDGFARPDGVQPAGEAAGFLEPEAFEDQVEAIAGEVFAEMGVRNLALRVEPGPAATDLGGEPLLGSYEPRREVDDAGYTQLEFLVTLYYRTFERQWRDGPYDVEAEIRETLRHEVEHHLHHLAGHDPMDAAEREEAEAEVARVVGGRRKARRALARSLGGDLLTFVRLVSPWALGALALGGFLAWLGNWL